LLRIEDDNLLERSNALEACCLPAVGQYGKIRVSILLAGAGNVTFTVETAFRDNSVHRPINTFYFTHNFNPFMFPIPTCHWYT
jgi:hypothetical protein